MRSPPFLWEYARLDTQSVDSVTRLMTPLSCILSNSHFMESLRAMGVFEEGRGGGDGGQYMLERLGRRRALLFREFC